jgi:prolyl-tRNA editing enzyme YbaK/EbsC (Cys-tRNA(Pro) deacylase)
MAAADAIETRVAAAEALAWSVPSNVAETELNAATRRVAAVARERRACGAALFRVPPEYYSLPLSERAALLCCPMDRLCKTIVLQFDSATPPAGFAGKYVAVMVQYAAKLDMDRVAKFLKGKGGAADLRLSMADKAAELTGFDFNGVSVVGMATPMPIIVAKPIAQLPAPALVWLGGGAPDMKLRMFVSQLLRHEVFAPEGAAGGAAESKGSWVHVVDCSIPRDADDAALD